MAKVLLVCVSSSIRSLLLFKCFDYHRSPLQFQAMQHIAKHWERPSSRNCQSFSIKADTGADALQSDPVAGSSRASMLTQEQCCSLCTTVLGCQGFQFTAEDQTCELYRALPESATIPWAGAFLGTLKNSVSNIKRDVRCRFFFVCD